MRESGVACDASIIEIVAAGSSFMTGGTDTVALTGLFAALDRGGSNALLVSICCSVEADMYFATSIVLRLPVLSLIS